LYKNNPLDHFADTSWTTNPTGRRHVCFDSNQVLRAIRENNSQKQTIRFKTKLSRFRMGKPIEEETSPKASIILCAFNKTATASFSLTV